MTLAEFFYLYTRPRSEGHLVKFEVCCLKFAAARSVYASVAHIV